MVRKECRGAPNIPGKAKMEKVPAWLHFFYLPDHSSLLAAGLAQGEPTKISSFLEYITRSRDVVNDAVQK